MKAPWGDYALREKHGGSAFCFSEHACFLTGYLKLRRRLTSADFKILLLNDKKNDSSIDSTDDRRTLNGKWSILIWIDGVEHEGGITY